MHNDTLYRLPLSAGEPTRQQDMPQRKQLRTYLNFTQVEFEKNFHK